MEKIIVLVILLRFNSKKNRFIDKQEARTRSKDL